MKIQNIIIRHCLLLTLVCFSLVGCNKYFNYLDWKNRKPEQVWADSETIANSLGAIYMQLPEGFNDVDGAFEDAATDNAKHLNKNSRISQLNNGKWNMFDDPMTKWENLYRGIYLADVFISNTDTVTLYHYQYNMNQKRNEMAKIQRYRGEARCLKAYFYFELMKRYGEIPLIEERNSKTYEPEGNLEKRSIKEIMTFIEYYALESLEYLPNKQTLTGNNYKNNLGHVFQGTAYAILSRAFLYAGSELFTSNDQEKREYLDKSAKYSAKLFNMGYRLVPRYGDLFTPNSPVMNNNVETIWDRRNTANTNMESMNQPVGFYRGEGQTNPTQELVDCYEFRDGTPGSSIDWNDPDLDESIYKDRDLRFDATIVYNGADIGRYREIGGIDRSNVECFIGGLDASSKDVTGTSTGYYLKKHVFVAADLSRDGQGRRHYWQFFRFGEILLNYAEAMNELYGPNEDPDHYGRTALSAVNEIRLRAGLIPLDAGITQEALRTRIRSERRVELAFEGHRYWDVRRWKIAPETVGQPVHGVIIKRSLDADNHEHFIYKKIKVEDRVFQEKMYFHPIPSSEFLSGTYDQNPGW